MRKLKWLFVAAVAVLMSACAASGPKVRTDRDPTANLSSYRSFGFYDQLLGDRARYSTVMSSRLRAANVAELTRLGYTYDPRRRDSGRSAGRATSRQSATRPGLCASTSSTFVATRRCGRRSLRARFRRRR